MLMAVPTEVRTGETRVAATPETVKKLIAAGAEVLVQQGAGAASVIPDAQYEEAGAGIAGSAKELYGKADVVLKVRGPEQGELPLMKKGAAVIGMLSPFNNELLEEYGKSGLTCFSLELVPRISRAQNMDVLSSQANIAGYKAVLLAAEHYKRFFPMLMTAAGTVQPARTLVLGAGVAGLQAIATARRLGAMVEAFDVRAAAKEQVESLGAKFVEVSGEEDAEDAGGYAREMSEEYRRKQSELLEKHVMAADIVITTALIPGKPAPVLVTEAMVEQMKPGSVVVDMAVEMGGNCEASELDKVVEKHGVTLVGISNIPALMSADASSLYARNVFNFVQPMLADKGAALGVDTEDEVVEATLLCRDGEFLKPRLLGKEEA